MKNIPSQAEKLISEAQIAVVIPAHNEEKNISLVVDTIPKFINYIVVVNDLSSDNTSKILKSLKKKNKRLVVVEHEKNLGVGGAIASGYEWARDNEMDAAVVMAGDGQMDPEDLPQLLEPVICEDVNYAKGNRLLYPGAIEIIPKIRFWGNSVLSLLTKVASGYWHVSDSQCGYTVIDKKALQTINWRDMYPRYGQPNDLLVSLNINNFTVKDVPVKPLYNVGEISGLKIRKVFFSISWLIIRRFFNRLKIKYVVKDFHPLVFFYFIAILLTLMSVFLLGRVIWVSSVYGYTPPMTSMAFMFTATTSLQSFFFAMWMDMEANKFLRR